MSKTEDLRSLQYFWQEKGDITRMIDHERVLRENPEVAAAWRSLKTAEGVFRLTLRGAIDEAEYEIP